MGALVALSGVVGNVIAGRTRAKYRCRFLCRLSFLKRRSLLSLLLPIAFFGGGVIGVIRAFAPDV